MNEYLKSLLEKIVEERKNSLLLLSLSEIIPESVLTTESVLGNEKFEELDIILQTPGGDPHAAFNIIKLLRKRAKKINIIVPLYAKSAGTLICLGADKILMSEISELGPLDTQIAESRQGDVQYKSALNGFKALEQIQIHAFENLDLATKLILDKSGLKMLEAIGLAIEFSGKTSACLYDQLDPLSIGEYKRSLEISEQYGHIILLRYMNWSKEKAHATISSLIYEYPSHDSIIDQDELKRLGFTVEEINNNELEIIRKLRMILIEEEDSVIHLIKKEIVKNKKIV